MTNKNTCNFSKNFYCSSIESQSENWNFELFDLPIPILQFFTDCWSMSEINENLLIEIFFGTLSIILIYSA
jgi:hypothetical protein